jgi:2-dehydro-3-deoxyphosphogluconate aldolase/(4S)-4-hydroxy-2-oxoglutarate aldolase
MGVPIVPGCVTPTEIERALGLSIDILKFFPAGMYGGVNGCKNLYGPYRMVKFIPTGGVSLNNLGEYIDKPFIHAVGGSWICKQSDIINGNFAAITDSCKKSVEILIGFDIDNPAVVEKTPNMERAEYHLILSGYEKIAENTYKHKKTGKSVELK